jgi:MEMO1 family protein
MKDSDLLPKLRHIEVVPLDQDGQETFLLRDPQQLSEQALTVSHPVLFCLQFFDGATQLATLAAMWEKATEGAPLPIEQVEMIVAELDRCFLLENEAMAERLNEVVAEFAALPLRPTRFADGAALDACYREAMLPAPKFIPAETNDLAVLVAPHIDFVRGGAAWAEAYALAKRRFSGDVVVILGVNHQPHGTPVALTRKTFQTPFGDVETAVELVDEISAALPFDAFADEFSHRDEHSIELAAIALKHAYGDACPKIVPILCGSLEEFIGRQIPPTEAQVIVAVHEALRAMIERLGDRVLMLASVDLAHIGPQFGAPMPIVDEEMEQSLSRDRHLLEEVVKGNAAGFFGMLTAEGNARNVCGAAPIYHALTTVPVGASAAEASLHFWRADDDTGAVSFAAVGLLRP